MRCKFSIAFLFLCFISMNALAQSSKKEGNSRITSSSYLENLIKKGSTTDYVITSEHVSSISGVKHIYVRQAVNGIEVGGTESSIHLDAGGQVIAAHVNFVNAIDESIKEASGTIDAKQAIVSISEQMGYNLRSLELKESAKGINRKTLYNKGGISTRDIPAQLMYYFKDGIGTKLVWEIAVKETQSADWWNFRVDATSGEIIDKDNWVVQCASSCNHNEHSLTEKVIENCDTNEVEEMSMVGGYRVFAFPIESPYYGTRTLETNPDDPTASPFGWHDVDGISGAEYTYTKGNNVDAYDDEVGDDTGSVSDHAPESSSGLVFDYPFEQTSGGLPVYTNANQSTNAAITNVFYWSNIIHDAMYQYGFDEAAGNFQENNYGNGGAGSDSVDAEAQDGSGTCNANFGTPTDGGNPQMQMYVCDRNNNNISNDGDYDNVVIIHEYGHGISNRLTGGPGTANSLQNAEQMGEGWSDYYGYMLTMTPSNYNNDRTTGTFLFEQGAGGAGLRNAPYSTSMSTNPWTYAGVANTAVISQPHGIGFIWASMLFEMTQGLITKHGFDPDIYNGSGGNNISLQLVTEGLKLQPTSPGFVDGRDAILAADLALNGGANECEIWAAFAKRGLGFSAFQGSSNSRTDGVEAFDLPIASFTVNMDTFCDSEGVIMGLSGGSGYTTGGTYSGTGVTDDGNGMTFSFDTGIAGAGAHVITYTDSNCGAVTIATDTINVTDGTPVLLCRDVTVTLDGMGNATIVEEDVIENLQGRDGGLGYTIDQSGIYNNINISSGATTLSLIDDDGSDPISFGFDFSFFGIPYSEFYISSNGYLTFEADDITDPSNDVLPTATLPDNIIAAVWDDLDPNVGGTIRYKEIGTAPNRIMVVDYLNVPHWTSSGNSTDMISTQVQLYEGTNRIEIHTSRADSDGATRTQGIENADGTLAFTVSGRNGVDWNLPSGSTDYVAFEPIIGGLANNCGNPVTASLSKSNFNCKDIGTNIVTVTANDGNGGIATCDATVTVIGETTYYTGTWDNGVPDSGKKAFFKSNYNSSLGDITACSCEVGNNATVTIGAGDYMNIEGNIKVGSGSVLTAEHQGSIVQNDNSAIVINEGTINVNITTPSLDPRDFMILGSPMTNEDATAFVSLNGSGAPAYQVLNHSTENFTPYVGVPPVVGVNFHDQEADDWSNHINLNSAAEGYLVRPSFTNAGVYNYQFNQGTLNNGIITYSAYFGDDKEDSPNIISNPYPSAIDANLLISSNPIINELYFWEHNTTPSTGIPGPLSENFNMEDISTRNYLMGIAAASGGGIPNNVISTGQGFGIKANAAGDVTFHNGLRLNTGNTTLRQSNAKDLIWIDVHESEYGMGSTTGIGFTEGATPGLDEGYDTMKLGTVVSLYSHIQNGSEQLGIQGREAFDSSLTIPMGFSTLIEANGDLMYTISIANFEGVNIENATVYLQDHLMNSITNLSDGNYDFISDAGTYNNRFTLRFEPIVLGTVDLELEAISIYPNPTENIVNLVSPKTVITAVEIFDVQGRAVSKISFASEANYQVDLSELETAWYFMQIKTDSGTITKRIMKK